MLTASSLVGAVVMLLGVAFIITAIVQLLRRRGSHGVELWLLAVTGALLILFGRWLIQ